MSFFKKIPVKLSLLLVHSHWSSLLFQFPFLYKYFPSCLCFIKILQTRKLFPARFITRLAFCHPVRFVSANSRYDLSDSSCYPARIEMQLLLSPNSSNQQLFEKKFDYLKRFTTTRDGPPTALQFYDIHIYVKFTSTKFSDFQIPLVYSHGYSWISRIKIILLNKMHLQGGANFS